MYKLEKRIRTMAKKWAYTPEELSWSLSQAKLNPEAWERACSYDED